MPSVRPRVVTCTVWCDICRHLRILGAWKMLVAPQSIIAHMHHILPFLSHICSSWIMCAESSISVLHRYSPNILALWLSRTTVDFSEIQWGWTSSRVAISACAANFSVPSSVTSNLPHRARCHWRYTSFLLAECRRMVGAWFVDCHHCHLCLCLCHLWGWVYLGSSTYSILGIGRFYDCHHIVGISCWLSVMHIPPRWPMATKLDLSHHCCRMAYCTCWAWMGS